MTLGNVRELIRASSAIAGNFHVRTDNHGGTIVTGPPVKTETDVQNVALVNPHQT